MSQATDLMTFIILNKNLLNLKPSKFNLSNKNIPNGFSNILNLGYIMKDRKKKENM